jgi:hypothetical protein
MIAEAFFTEVAVRARVAFGVRLAERNLWRVSHNAPGLAFARKSLDLVWDWTAGVPVSPKLLSDALLDENGEGLGTFEYQAPEEEKDVWVLLENAVAYGGWHAYTDAGEPMPDPINETRERGIRWIIEYAMKVEPSDEPLMNELAAYCLARYRANYPWELGAAVNRLSLTNVG